MIINAAKWILFNRTQAAIFDCIWMTVVIILIVIKSNKKKIDVESPHTTESNEIDWNKYYDTNKYEQIKEEKQRTYKKKGIMTECEKEYYSILRQVIKPQYTIQPQIPLSSIVNKEKAKSWKTPLELFRTIDFGILDEQFNIICVIEINDRTHYQQKRMERDAKVKEILEEANIPILTLWTDDSKSDGFIKREIEIQIPKVNYIVN